MEPGALIASLGRNYVDATKVKKYEDGLRAGIIIGRRIEQLEQEKRNGQQG
jgi:hypothetical protein